MNSGMSGMNHHSNQMLGGMSSSGGYSSGNSGMSGMNHHSNQISGSMSSGDYARGNSGMSGTNQMLGGTSSGGYSSGSAQRNMHSSTGTGIRKSNNMRSSSLSSGSQSVPEIEYQDILETLEEFSEVDQRNTVFIQNHGSAGNNGMQNHGSSGSYGMQNQGR